MRRTSLLAALLRSRALRQQRPPDKPTDDVAGAREIRKEAEEKGFLRRDSAGAQVYMNQVFHRPQDVGDGIRVANLPEESKGNTAFDEYQRSTADFTTFVSPHGVPDAGLGAGFGAREDKRFSFLRPRNVLQPFSTSTGVVPKYDENGMPVGETQLPGQVLRKRKEYLKSFEGTAMSHREHFLLADLDFDKDSILFGSTREEFERNVKKLKRVIVAYSAWERRDNVYYYATIVLRILTLWIVMECLFQYDEMRLFSQHYADFALITEEEIASLEEKRELAYAEAAAELRRNPPSFDSVVAAILAEKARTEGSPSPSASPGKERRGDHNARQGATQAEVAAGNASDLLRRSPVYHPMDTTGELAHHERHKRQQTEKEIKQLFEQMPRDVECSFWQRLWRRLFGTAGAPTLLIQPADLAQYSYAASPTSIETLRAIRRVLLPRSEDYTQIVREEMQQYKLEKMRRSHHVT